MTSESVQEAARVEPLLRGVDAAGDNRMRVLVLMEAREFGGPAKNLVDTIGLLRGKTDFRVVTFIRGDTPSTEFTERLEHAGVACSVIRERFRYDPKGITTLRRVVREYQPDIIQVHNNKSRFYMYLLQSIRLLHGFQTIDCYHGETWTDRKQLAYNRLDRWLFRQARNIIVVSKTQEELLVSFGVSRDRITVIYNGIQLKPSSYRRAGNGLEVVTIGRMSKEKGHGELLRAVKILTDKGIQGFALTFVGDGPEMERLRVKVEATGLQDLVRFVGYQSDPTPYYERADLFVLPSLSEGIPNVLLEAAMHHVPIVTTPVGGIREMFAEETEAVFVPAGDAVALARAIQRCLSDGALRESLALAARERIERDFTQETRGRRYFDYYARLVRPTASDVER